MSQYTIDFMLKEGLEFGLEELLVVTITVSVDTQF